MLYNNFTEKLTGLQDLIVTKVEDNEKKYIFMVKLSENLTNALAAANIQTRYMIIVSKILKIYPLSEERLLYIYVNAVIAVIAEKDFLKIISSCRVITE